MMKSSLKAIHVHVQLGVGVGGGVGGGAIVSISSACKADWEMNTVQFSFLIYLQKAHPSVWSPSGQYRTLIDQA